MDIIEELTEFIKEKYNPDKIILIKNHSIENQKNNNEFEFLIIKDIPREKFSEHRINLKSLVKKFVLKNNINIDFLICNEEVIKERIDNGDHFISEIYIEENIIYDKNIPSIQRT